MNSAAQGTENSTRGPKDWVESMRQTRDRLIKKGPRAFPPGGKRKCPECQKRTLESREDLVRETTVGAIVLLHHNLHGARCTHCKTEFLESYEEITREEHGLNESSRIIRQK